MLHVLISITSGVVANGVRYEAGERYTVPAGVAGVLTQEGHAIPLEVPEQVDNAVDSEKPVPAAARASLLEQLKALAPQPPQPAEPAPLPPEVPAPPPAPAQEE